jgi:predicted MPP superfamily phosphohydrolase
VVTEKLEVETYGRVELEELQRKLLQERAETKARLDAEAKNSASLLQHKRNLEGERDAKLASMRADAEGVENKIQAEKAAMQEWASLAKEEEGEESVLIKKIDANQEAHQEMEMTQRRLQDILAEINAQVPPSRTHSYSLLHRPQPRPNALISGQR